jgi:hypothetical protein
MESYLLTHGHPDPFRSVHDLGHVPVGCPVRRTGKSFIRVAPGVARPPSVAGTSRSPLGPLQRCALRPAQSLPNPTAVPEGYPADEAPAAMTARSPRTRGARISGFPRSSPADEGAASGSAYGCTSPCLPAANIYRRSPSSSVCNDGQWSCALYLPARVGRCLGGPAAVLPWRGSACYVEGGYHLGIADEDHGGHGHVTLPLRLPGIPGSRPHATILPRLIR